MDKLKEGVKMTGSDLNERLLYLGMERDLRELALKSKLIKADKLALMPTIEICDLIVEHYEIVFSEKETIGLVKKEDFEKYKKIVKFIER